MNTVSVSPRAKTLNALLKTARLHDLILESAEGERFMLTSLDRWQGFEIGDSDDFTEEIKRTVQNRELTQLLDDRRRESKEQRYSIEEIKQELGIESGS